MALELLRSSSSSSSLATARALASSAASAAQPALDCNSSFRPATAARVAPRTSSLSGTARLMAAGSFSGMAFLAPALAAVPLPGSGCFSAHSFWRASDRLRTTSSDGVNGFSWEVQVKRACVGVGVGCEEAPEHEEQTRGSRCE